MPDLKFKVIQDGTLPTRAHPTDAGLDLCARLGATIPAGTTLQIPLGVAVEIPAGHVGMLAPRSSLLLMTGGLGMTAVIDADYRGELMGVIHAVGDRAVSISAGQRIYQLVITPIITPMPVPVLHLEDTQRGDGGFGSTGETQ